MRASCSDRKSHFTTIGAREKIRLCVLEQLEIAQLKREAPD
jgi:hypothetical protein